MTGLGVINWNRATFILLREKLQDAVTLVSDLKDVPLAESVERTLRDTLDALDRIMRLWNKALAEETRERG